MGRISSLESNKYCTVPMREQWYCVELISRHRFVAGDTFIAGCSGLNQPEVDRSILRMRKMMCTFSLFGDMSNVSCAGKETCRIGFLQKKQLKRAGNGTFRWRRTCILQRWCSEASGKRGPAVSGIVWCLEVTFRFYTDNTCSISN